MKKKKLALNKRLFLKKDAVMQLSKTGMGRIAGGEDTVFQCNSNGCSNVDTLCVVLQPTQIHTQCGPQPVTIGNTACEPQRSIDICPVKGPTGI